MGVRSILNSRRIVLMAWGQHKAEIVRQAVEGEVNSRVTASFLQEHANTLFVLDAAAAGSLTRYRTPWLVGPLAEQGLAWDERMTRRAILWLSQLRQKPILKLTDDDYNDAGLQDLLRAHGSAYDANLVGFYQMQHTITGWPGGRDPARTKPGDAPVRPLRSPSAGVFPKRVLLMSPHPDDDVISMGGTLCRLVDQGHEVHIAYQVSGAGAVSDEAVWRSLAFTRDSGLGDATDSLREMCALHERGEPLPASRELTRWKALIRRLEAISGARVCGVSDSRLHFLDLPFYDSAARSRRAGPADTAAVRALLGKIRPHLLYAAGDLDDPHGTHRICLRILARRGRALALPRRVGGMAARRNRSRGSAQPAGSAAPPPRDFPPRDAEGPGAVPRRRPPRILAAHRGPQPPARAGLQCPRTRGVRGDRGLSPLRPGGFRPLRGILIPSGLVKNTDSRWSGAGLEIAMTLRRASAKQDKIGNHPANPVRLVRT
jgi:LmbE family N-acetylglucosaminyl deacetylase